MRRAFAASTGLPGSRFAERSRTVANGLANNANAANANAPNAHCERERSRPLPNLLLPSPFPLPAAAYPASPPAPPPHPAPRRRATRSAPPPPRRAREASAPPVATNGGRKPPGGRPPCGDCGVPCPLEPQEGTTARHPTARVRPTHRSCDVVLGGWCRYAGLCGNLIFFNRNLYGKMDFASPLTRTAGPTRGCLRDHRPRRSLGSGRSTLACLLGISIRGAFANAGNARCERERSGLGGKKRSRAFANAPNANANANANALFPPRHSTSYLTSYTEVGSTLVGRPAIVFRRFPGRVLGGGSRGVPSSTGLQYYGSTT